MNETDIVCFPTGSIGAAPFNLDPCRFAIVAGDEHTAALVTGLVLTFRGTEDDDAREEVLLELIDLHAQHRVLWPIGIFHSHSALGSLPIVKLCSAIAEVDPEFIAMRRVLEKNKCLRFANWCEANRRNHAFASWRVIAAAKYATTVVITCLEDLSQQAFDSYVSVVQPNGVWVDWLPGFLRIAPRGLAEYLGNAAGDVPYHGTSIRRAMPMGARHRSHYVWNQDTVWLREDYDRWLDSRATLTQRGAKRGLRLLHKYLSENRGVAASNPTEMFCRSNVQSLLSCAKTFSTPGQRGLVLGYVFEFAQWLVDESRDDSGHPRCKIEIYESDLRAFANANPTPQSASSGGDVAARPMPSRYHLRLKEIIEGNDFAWPKSLKDSISGASKHFVKYFKRDTGTWEDIFCPVLPRMLLLQLDMPLRNVQVRRLDSGEGDRHRWNPHTQKWEPNAGPLMGYWAKAGARVPDRGAIRRMPSFDGSAITGLFINSNKTQDRGVLFDENAGYEIPWEHPDVLQNLAAMRDWQETYNPVDVPLAYADLPHNTFGEEPSEVVRALIPDRFYLFRDPRNLGELGRQAPPPFAVFLQFFYDALDELERRLNEEDPENPIEIITRRDASGLPKKAIFTSHGMRSSTLTALHLAGVPIEVLSKLVAGHASILMTLKYTKFEPHHVSQVLNDARRKAESEAQANFPNFLAKSSFEQALRMTARLHDDGLQQVASAPSEKSRWSRLDIGLCPNGCTMCHVGGDAIHRKSDKGTDKSPHRPVPGGARNCIRCRFFITGLPFLIPLWAHSASLATKADGLAREAVEKETEGVEAKSARKTLVQRSETVPQDLRERILLLEEAWLQKSEQRDHALVDLHHCLTLIEKVRAIATMNDGEDRSELPMLIPEDGIPVVVGRETSRFEATDAVVQASRVYPSLRSPEIEGERDEFLNKILYRNGYVPITMAPLSTAEKRRAADAMAAMLLIEVGAQETQNLIEGRATLSSLGLQDRLGDVCAKAIGNPERRLALVPPTYPTIDLKAAE